MARRTAPAAQPSPRDRYRAQVRAEIKEHAWEQIAGSGASALSLNAIARRMGMTGPALYRYFGSRDELITALVTDAYRSVADTCLAAAAAPDASHASGADRLRTLAHALRNWALADPHRYFLIYGTPVPGYHAPEDVTLIAAEIMAVLLDVCAALPADGGEAGPDEAGFDAHLAGHREWDRGHPAPAPVLRRALAVWTRLHGALSLELAGHFTGMGFDPELLFEAELDGLVRGTRPDGVQ
ncbi:TetR/AcrR family transcriptional regulator [Streptomyces sp. NPDC047000]|uniref:TetR/AcrR family transcriptional regulator n=1 Tax=Streptomyces sp. NPDC047000 TaxID=3155474 RepID=UPI0033D4D3CC